MKSYWKALTYGRASRKKSARRRPLRRLVGHVESLEPRSLLATIVLMNSDLVVNGNDHPDAITIQSKGTQVEVSVVDLSTNTTEKKSFPAAQVGRIIASGRGGDDVVVNHTSIPDRLFGEQGNDTLLGGAGQSYIDGGDGDDTLLGRDGNDVVVGGDGHDTLRGGSGNDVLSGDLGNDTLYGDAGDDWLSGDIIFNTLAGGGDDCLFGGDGEDALGGGVGKDLLDGGGDGIQDRLTGQDGADVFVLYVASKEDSLEDFKLSEGDAVKWVCRTAEPFPGPSPPLKPEVSPIPTISLANGNLLVVGNDNPELITIQMSGYQVEMSVVDSVTSSTQTAVFFAAQVSQIIAGGMGGSDIIVNNTNIPDFLGGGQGSDILLGGAGDSYLFGGDGNDTLRGGIGNDELVGGKGNDQVFGDGGDDTLFGGLGKEDTPSLAEFSSGWEVDDDVLNGGSGQDVLDGQSGNDSLDGGGDGVQDKLRGRSGADVFIQHGAGGEDLLLDVMRPQGDVVVSFVVDVVPPQGVVCKGLALKSSLLQVSPALSVSPSTRDGLEGKQAQDQAAPPANARATSSCLYAGPQKGPVGSLHDALPLGAVDDFFAALGRGGLAQLGSAMRLYV